jgi:predicted nucleic acid-binding Zn ribbon protein
MINEVLPEKKLCPFCGTPLPDDIARCRECGGEEVKGYTSRNERRVLMLLRLILCAAAIIYFCYFYPASENAVITTLLLFIACCIAIVVPGLFFKVKNKNNVIWKKKNTW